MDFRLYGRRLSGRSISVVCAGFLLVALCISNAQGQDTSKRGRKYKNPPATAHFEVTVLRATTGKPVENASVIFHPLENGRDNGNMELKTNDEGKASLDLLSMGSNVRVQVIAPGFQTYGEDYKVDKDTMAVEVKLKRPAGQYSIYKKSEGAGAAADKPADASKDAAPDTTKDTAPKDAPKDAPKAADSTPQPK